MFDLDLLPLRPQSTYARRLRLRLDTEAGTLTGPDAAFALDFLRQLVADGSAPNPHPPGDVPMTDPLHRPDEFAVAFATDWRLPPELVAYLPPPPPPAETSGLGEFDVLLDR